MVEVGLIGAGLTFLTIGEVESIFTERAALVPSGLPAASSAVTLQL